MPIKVYGNQVSPPVRGTLLTLKALGLEYELEMINLLNGDHMSEEFLKMNPTHTIPTIEEEDGFIVYDSHAINCYLVNKYANNNQLYPADFKERSVVDRMLYYDCGTIFKTIANFAKEVFFRKSITGHTTETVESFEEVYRTLELVLKDTEFIAKNEITLADFSVIASLATTNLILPVNNEIYPRVVAYIDRCKSSIAGYEEINGPGLDIFKELLKDFNFEMPAE